MKFCRCPAANSLVTEIRKSHGYESIGIYVHQEHFLYTCSICGQIWGISINNNLTGDYRNKWIWAIHLGGIYL